MISASPLSPTQSEQHKINQNNTRAARPSRGCPRGGLSASEGEREETAGFLFGLNSMAVEGLHCGISTVQAQRGLASLEVDYVAGKSTVTSAYSSTPLQQ